MNQFQINGYPDTTRASATTVAGPAGQSEIIKQFVALKQSGVYPDGITVIDFCKIEILETGISTAKPKKPTTKKNEKTS